MVEERNEIDHAMEAISVTRTPGRLTLMVLVGAMAAGAIAVRMQGLDQTLVTFHATRHYRSALLERACYYDRAPSAPRWAQAVARANREMQPAGEPPLMEAVACGIYLVTGRENVAIPRLLAAVAWVAGVVPLLWLALRIARPAAAVVGAALYLFLPYGIIASRNFQPDTLMTLASLAALVMAVRYDEQATSRRMVIAALAIAAAALIKPMSVFLTVPVVVLLAATRPRQCERAPAWIALLLLALSPPALYYGYGTLFGSLARDQMRMRFVPELLGSSFFWRGLATQVGKVLSLPLFMLAIAGGVVTRHHLGRLLLFALFGGYLLFAAAFTYHMPTHDYYHLPYIAVAALGVTALLDRLENVLARPRPALAVSVALSVLIAGFGIERAWPALRNANSHAQVSSYERIGELTEHDVKVIFLDAEYGYPLMYHGQLSGDSWPSGDDLAAEAVTGMEPLSADARFERDYAAFSPRYFVVTDLASLAAAADLQAMLARRAIVVEQAADYHVYRFVS